jgi:hypothetical protein
MEKLRAEGLELSIFKITFQNALHLRKIQKFLKQDTGNYNALNLSTKILCSETNVMRNYKVLKYM